MQHLSVSQVTYCLTLPGMIFLPGGILFHRMLQAFLFSTLSTSLSLSLYIYFYLFIWLHLVAAQRIFSCSMWDLVP